MKQIIALIILFLVGCTAVPDAEISTAVPTRTVAPTAETTAVSTPTPLPHPSPSPMAVPSTPTPSTQLAPIPAGNLVLFAQLQPVIDAPYWALQTAPALPLFEQPVFEKFYGRHTQLPDGPVLYFHNFAPQASPDGRYLALPGIGGYDNPSGDLGAGFWLADLQTGSARQLLPQARPFTWSPHSQAITFADDGVLYTLNVADETAVPVSLFSHPGLVDLWVRWSPDGRWIAAVTLEPSRIDATGYPQHTEIIWLVPTNGEPAFELARRLFAAIEHVVDEISWSADGRYLRVPNEVLNLAGEAVSPPLPGRLTWLPGENNLLLNGSDGLRLVNPTGLELARISETTSPTWDFAISPDGRRIAFVSPDDNRRLFIYDLQTEESMFIGSSPDGPIGTIHWTADNAYLVMGGGTANTPIWLLAAQPNSLPEIIVERGVLMDVVGVLDTAVSP